MKKTAFILTIIVLLSGCKLTKEERRLNRGTKKLEKLVRKFPELKQTKKMQVIAPEFRVDGSTSMTINSGAMDAIRKELEALGGDSTTVESIIEYIPLACDIDPVHIDNDDVEADIWVESGRLRYEFRVKPRKVEAEYDTIQPKEVVPSSKSGKWYDKLLLFLAGVAVGGIGVFLIRRR